MSGRTKIANLTIYILMINHESLSSPRFPVLHHLLELAQTHVHWVGNAIQPSHPLSSHSPTAFDLSQHQDLFQWVSCLHQVAKVWELLLQISLSSEYSGLISFKIDWFDLFAVQGTLESLLQPHSLKASVLPWSAFGAQSIWSHGPKPCLTQWNHEPCHPRQTGHAEQFWQNTVHWRRERLENCMNGIKRQKDMMLKDELHRSVGSQYAPWEEWRNNSRKNEETEPKQTNKQTPSCGCDWWWK